MLYHGVQVHLRSHEPVLEHDVEDARCEPLECLSWLDQTQWEVRRAEVVLSELVHWMMHGFVRAATVTLVSDLLGLLSWLLL